MVSVCGLRDGPVAERRRVENRIADIALLRCVESDDEDESSDVSDEPVVHTQRWCDRASRQRTVCHGMLFGKNQCAARGVSGGADRLVVELRGTLVIGASTRRATSGRAHLQTFLKRMANLVRHIDLIGRVRLQRAMKSLVSVNKQTEPKANTL